MKSCEEMMDSLLARREAYRIQQKKRRTVLTRTAASLCLAALLGAAVWQGIGWRSDVREPAPADGEVVFHSVDSFPQNNSYIAILWEDFVPMTREQLNAYYGVDVFPTVPRDLQETEENETLGIFRRDGGTGEVYWDSTLLAYDSTDGSRTLQVEISKCDLPASDYLFLDPALEKLEKSVVGGVEMTLAQTADGTLDAQFLYRDVDFRVTAQGLSREEFVAVLLSLVS